MIPPAPARIQGYFSRKGHVCVIVRRGPSKYSQFILWRTDIDYFEPGQWMRGKVESLTLSSDGAYAAVHVMGAKSRVHSWEDTQLSILCRPPYFTALEIWIGGLCMATVDFLSDDRLYASECDHQVYARNRCPFKRTKSYDPQAINQGRGHVIDATWRAATGIDQRGRRILMHEGKIYAGNAGEERLLFDCNEYSFEEIVAPKWAKRW